VAVDHLSDGCFRDHASTVEVSLAPSKRITGASEMSGV
jgi:hypothetical protein